LLKEFLSLEQLMDYLVTDRGPVEATVVLLTHPNVVQTPKLKNKLVAALAFLKDEAQRLGLSEPTEEYSRSDQWRASIHLAAEHDNLPAVKALLARGADSNVKDRNGETSLHLAVRRSNFPVIKALLDGGADSNIRDLLGNRTPLHWSVEYNNLQAVEALLACGADPNIQDSLGKTPLHWAVVHKNLPIFEALLASSADLNIPDHNGKTPLHFAVSNNHISLLEALEARGIDLKHNNLQTTEVLSAGGVKLNVAKGAGIKNKVYGLCSKVWQAVPF
jgi:ankyrin repeat protein